ncbi:DNA gyrase subunit A [Fagus crenata]
MEDFEKKVSIKEPMETDEAACSSSSSSSSKIVHLLRSFLAIQQRRAQAYAKLKSGFTEYMVSGGELPYQQLCSEITQEFNDCSKQVLEMESLFMNPDYGRTDLAQLLRAVQEQEKQKLHLTATIQVLKKAGHPSERLVSHENCRYKTAMEHECVHVHEITEAVGTEEAEANAEYDNALKEAIRGVQNAVTAINEHLEEVRYEIAALEAE